MKRFFQRLASALGRIALVDWFLLLFMAVLLGHTVFTVFFGAPPEETSAVDVIVRTSAAAIFGYFLSRNSLQASPAAAAPPPPSLGGGGVAGLTGRIGFSLSDSPQEPLASGAAFSSAGGGACSRFQVCAVSCIGLFSLVLLLLMREGIASNASMTATASQLRDFVSASVGFLVSCGKTSRE